MPGGRGGTIVGMSEAPRTRRRWFQFSLGTALVLVALAAVFLAYHANWIRERHTLLARARVYYLEEGRAPRALRVFGEGGYRRIHFMPRDTDWPTAEQQREAAARMAYMFPEAEVSVQERRILADEVTPE
jgi:hypothetical protein